MPVVRDLIKGIVAVVLAFLFAEPSAGAAVLRGKVVDCDNGEPLPYATIKVRNRYGGAIADTAGVFELYGRFQAGDTVVVSYVGYKAADVIAGSLAVDSACTAIRLEPLVMPLPEMSVRPKKQKRKRAGKKYATGMFSCCFNGKTQGEAMGYEFHSKEGCSMWLDRVGLYVKNEPVVADSIKFRVNIYDMSKVHTDPTTDFVNVLKTPIVFDYKKKDIQNGVYQYVLPELIRLPEHAMVEIEFLEDVGDRVLLYKCNMMGKNSWSRSGDEFWWCKNPAAGPFFIECLEIRR